MPAQSRPRGQGWGEKCGLTPTFLTSTIMSILKGEDYSAPQREESRQVIWVEITEEQS